MNKWKIIAKYKEFPQMPKKHISKIYNNYNYLLYFFKRFIWHKICIFCDYLVLPKAGMQDGNESLFESASGRMWFRGIGHFEGSNNRHIHLNI